MTLEQVIQDIFNRAPALVEQVLMANYDKLGSAVSPIAVGLASGWLGVKVISTWIGREPADIWPWVRAMLLITFVFAALSWGGVAGKIYHSYNELRSDTTRALMGGKGLLEYMGDANDVFSKASDDLMKHSWMDLGIVVIGAVLMVLNSILAVLVLVLGISSDVGTGITMLLFPLFVPALFFNSTRGSAMAWFGAMLKFALVGVVLVVSVFFATELSKVGLASVKTAELQVEDAQIVLGLEIFMIVFIAIGVWPLASALASSHAAGSGVASAAMSFAGGKLGQALGFGKTAASVAKAQDAASQALTQLAQGQGESTRVLQQINEQLHRGGLNGTTSAQALQSGAGQPGGAGGQMASTGSRAPAKPKW
ncbi:TPA: type IV secretion system protein [Burkholderia vietnamiensis]|uniref:type IV secretion system protein n=1 Tax=Burkholderia cepacia complex TaxID=87882 RepID=UPI0015934004|nr:type IV secretion system protein [Burkholderia vietnamiensis]MBU9658305.1 type IV secretion system protein [Burkholderia cenocepacia]HDR8918749.1 type IV secretion system protein [Burkholderia vietnamiensis]HDR8976939.1 type IV secretion system protein [Burkholderia vietnamiensis]HDR9049904.1 type IV secretion system protein [Burkholderia vietnamiensis]HDR9191175.1 type IV secretion system protein [Burkholderia vietnamiensis]